MWTQTAARTAPALETCHLSRRFGLVWAVVDVALTLERGEALLVAGSNGSGKSTLLRLLAGALRPDRGEVRIHGLADRRDLLARTALLGHSPYTYESLTALENLELFAKLVGRPASRAALLERLEEVGLAAHADEPASRFSTGMGKRLSLARLLLQEPAVALLDEPHSALDAEGARKVDAVIQDLKRRGAAVVVASHHLARLACLCERGIVLERGRIQWAGLAGDLARAGTALGDPGGTT